MDCVTMAPATQLEVDTLKCAREHLSDYVVVSSVRW